MNSILIFYTVSILTTIIAAIGALAAPQASAQSLTTYGTPGLIEMPTAEVMQDGDLAFTASVFGPNFRYTGAFQVLPRVYGGFRYSQIKNINGATGYLGGDTFDRSFDIHYQIFDETSRRPAVAIGLRDFLGTGILSGEYFVATKSFGSKLEVTGGLGWGRLAGRNSLTALKPDQPDSRVGEGRSKRATGSAALLRHLPG